MELHTFSSLMAEFLPQYKDCMKEADIAYVYFNPKVIEHKRLTPITAEEVREAFGTANVEVFTDSEALISAVSHQYSAFSNQGVALLMMSSGTFDGVDVKQFATELLENS
jgi:UDP-N-acetylmuramate: L-alanyl-gamma-D-glutamyl-meso-diaminopimelate ligase